MISISGIGHQKLLESLPYFTKSQAGLLIGKSGRNLDGKLAQLSRLGYLISLKKNLYVTDAYLSVIGRPHYIELIANTLCSPSYLSLEYILAKAGLIPEGVQGLESIALKSSRIFKSSLGIFSYHNIKPGLFTGYRRIEWEDKIILEATPAKALFDFLYLRKMLNIRIELTLDLRLNWDHFSRADYLEFNQYVDLAKSPKMRKISRIIEELHAH
ncbi:MAG: hypothetical protein G01um101416_1212 [Microgenomates group bacterium Gr01-1014_16]|nr:MAG: hypothetical protein G01um101416_1212 [Microgenomates group bacterium Gr01-1014_16]